MIRENAFDWDLTSDGPKGLKFVAGVDIRCATIQ